jgi:hypothetical protein
VPWSLLAVDSKLPAAPFQGQAPTTERSDSDRATVIRRSNPQHPIPIQRMQRWRAILVVWWWCSLLTAPTSYAAQDTIRGDRPAAAARAEKETKSSPENVFDETNANTDNGKQSHPPNVLIFVVDDLGWNQVGYHANPAGNLEIKTPHIDAHAAAGLALNRGYMTPW